MTINEFLRKNRNLANGLSSQVFCKDGFNMSVQGSAGSYSSPKQDFASYYDEVEVGYPSQSESLLRPYGNKKEGELFTWVPVGVVEQIIQKHGGYA